MVEPSTKYYTKEWLQCDGIQDVTCDKQESEEQNRLNKANEKFIQFQSAPITIPIESETAPSGEWPKSFYSATVQSLPFSMDSRGGTGTLGARQCQNIKSAEILVAKSTQPINVQQGAWPQSWKSATNQLTPSPQPYSFVSSSFGYLRQREDLEPLLGDYLEDGRSGKDQTFEENGFVERKPEARDDYLIGKSSLLQTIMNGLNILCGIGMLATPYAVKSCGIGSIIFIIILACICIYTGMLLKYSMDLSGKNCVSYPDIGAAAFGYSGRIIIVIILYGELFACCVETLILGGDNFNELTNHATFIYDLDTQKFWTIVTTAILLPFAYIRDLRVVSIISACGFVFSMAVLVFIILFGIQFTEFAYLAERRFIDVQSVPIALGMYLYCFSGHSVFPNLYTGIRNKDRFLPALLWSFLLITIIYIVTALLGYGTFGPNTVQQITLSLHKTEPNVVVSQLAGWIVIISPFCTFPLLVTPIAQGLEELLPMGLGNFVFWVAVITIRTILILLALGVALSVPLFAYFASLVGSVFSTNISYVLPCICFMQLVRINRAQTNKFHWIACCAIPVIGVVVGAAGAFNALHAIYKALNSYNQ